MKSGIETSYESKCKGQAINVEREDIYPMGVENASYICSPYVMTTTEDQCDGATVNVNVFAIYYMM